MPLLYIDVEGSPTQSDSATSHFLIYTGNINRKSMHSKSNVMIIREGPGTSSATYIKSPGETSQLRSFELVCAMAPSPCPLSWEVMGLNLYGMYT